MRDSRLFRFSSSVNSIEQENTIIEFNNDDKTNESTPILKCFIKFDPFVEFFPEEDSGPISYHPVTTMMSELRPEDEKPIQNELRWKIISFAFILVSSVLVI